MNFVTGYSFLLIAAIANAGEPGDDSTVRLEIGANEPLVFRLISPRGYEIEYPDFYMLETEVTNAQFKAYLDATGKTKDDTEVLRIVRQREENRTSSTGDISYSIEDASTIWRAGRYPDGLGEHPVALITLGDASDFAKWLTQTNAKAGLVRLPTWNEWMIAAYGDSRNYPWGAEWEAKRAHTSYGIKYGFQARFRGEPDPNPKRTEPVENRPNGRTPDGIYGLIGNVSEYIVSGDSTNSGYFNLGSRWMGGGFTDGLAIFDDDPDRLLPRNDYWGYSHHSTSRSCDLGFRLVLDRTKKSDLLTRDRIFKQNNQTWMMDTGHRVESTPEQTVEQRDKAER